MQLFLSQLDVLYQQLQGLRSDEYRVVNYTDILINPTPYAAPMAQFLELPYATPNPGSDPNPKPIPAQFLKLLHSSASRSFIETRTLTLTLTLTQVRLRLALLHLVDQGQA